MSEVKIVKFVYGAEVIAKVVDNGTTVVLQSPLELRPMQRQDGFSLAMVPFSWAGNATEGVEISRQHILCLMDCESGLKTSYLANLAGITVPGAGDGPRITLSE